jgi:hypothetical protein
MTWKCVLGNFNASPAHRQALCQIISMRGGDHNLGMDGLLADLINM